MNSASFDLSITALVLILDVSRRELSHYVPVSLDYSANQVVMQIGELTIRGYFGPCSHVTETQGFVQQKKTERQAKTFKKVKLHSNKTVSSRSMHSPLALFTF